MEIKFGFKGVPGTLEMIQRQVGIGWSDILSRLVIDLETLGWNGEVVQVKEKFGSMRFYINHGTDEIHDRIGNAEDESSKTCEECGQSGELRSGGWIKCLCDIHAAGRAVWAMPTWNPPADMTEA